MTAMRAASMGLTPESSTASLTGMMAGVSHADNGNAFHSSGLEGSGFEGSAFDPPKLFQTSHSGRA